MYKVLRKSAKTEDEALRLALEELGLDRDDVSVEIIERAKSGFLGFGSAPAVIAVTYEVPDEVPPPVIEEPAAKEPPSEKRETKPPPRTAGKETRKPQKRAAGADSEKQKKTAEREKPVERESEVPVVQKSASPEKIEQVREFLSGLFVHFGTDVAIQAEESAEGAISVKLESSEAGALIGRRGETLDALQSITNYAVNKGSRGRTRILIDAENYRSRRGETLEALAERTAARVVRNRRNITLDPMNAYERHVIHAALQEHEYVSTHSVGSEPNRRVVITYGKSGTSHERTGAPRPEPRQKSRPAQEKQSGTAVTEKSESYPAESKNYREWK